MANKRKPTKKPTVIENSALSPQLKQVIQNAGLAQCFGLPSNNFYGPGVGSNPFAPQISQTNTLFENLRWYLVSNFRQPLSQAYTEIGLIQTVIDTPVDDALRGGIDINSRQLSEDQIRELKISFDRDDDLQTAGTAAKWSRLYGGSGIIVIVDDQDPESELDIAAIGPDSSFEFRSADLWELFPDSQNIEGYNPSDQTENFQFYNYYGVRVHKSRVMTMRGRTAPSFLRPRLRGWGLSEVETLIRSLNQYLKATDLAFACLDEFKVDVYKIKDLVNTLLDPNGYQRVQQRIMLANQQKNYQNAIVMDKEDDWDHKQISFAGLAETMQGIRMQVAADMHFPITKLFGTSASGGIGNTDQNDMENYNSMVESQVRNKIKYILLRMVEIKCQHLFGFIPDDLEINFKPLRVLSATDEETVKTSQFNRLLQAKQLGEISSKDFIDACNKSNLFPIQVDSIGDGLDADEASLDEIDNPLDPKDKDSGTDRKDVEPPSLWKKDKHLNALDVVVEEFSEYGIKCRVTQLRDGWFAPEIKVGENWLSSRSFMTLSDAEDECLRMVEAQLDGANRNPNVTLEEWKEKGIACRVCRQDDGWYYPEIKRGKLWFSSGSFSSLEEARHECQRLVQIELAPKLKNDVVLKEWTENGVKCRISKQPDGWFYAEVKRDGFWVSLQSVVSFDEAEYACKRQIQEELKGKVKKNSSPQDAKTLEFLKKFGIGALKYISSSDEENKMSNPGKVDEELWEKAKKAAADEGHPEKWALITYIYKKMGGVFK